MSKGSQMNARRELVWSVFPLATVAYVRKHRLWVGNTGRTNGLEVWAKSPSGAWNLLADEALRVRARRMKEDMALVLAHEPDFKVPEGVPEHEAWKAAAEPHKRAKREQWLASLAAPTTSTGRGE